MEPYEQNEKDEAMHMRAIAQSQLATEKPREAVRPLVKNTSDVLPIGKSLLALVGKAELEVRPEVPAEARERATINALDELRAWRKRWARLDEFALIFEMVDGMSKIETSASRDQD